MEKTSQQVAFPTWAPALISLVMDCDQRVVIWSKPFLLQVSFAQSTLEHKKQTRLELDQKWGLAGQTRRHCSGDDDKRVWELSVGDAIRCFRVQWALGRQCREQCRRWRLGLSSLRGMFESPSKVTRTLSLILWIKNLCFLVSWI